jgi:asparagine synthetase B (glutamine-hydrolysing)
VKWVTEDELETFDDLLDRVVDRAVDGGRAGIWLSGGLDSVTVAAVATDRCRHFGWPDPCALSIVFPHPDVNEERIQRGVAERLGLSHTLMGFFEAVGEEGMLPAALDMARTWPAPLLSYFLPAYQSLGRKGRRLGCTTILTGGGGDEWLSVSPTYAADMLLALDFRGLYRLGRSNHRSFRISRLRAARNLLWRFGANTLLRAAAATTLDRAAPWALQAHRRRRIARATPEWVAPDPLLRAAIDERALVRPKTRFGDFYMSEVRETLDHPLVAMEMEEVFENSRRFGVRLGQPFLDADIIDFLCRTPPELLIRGGRSKAVVRQMLARRFPELGFERQRKLVANAFSRPLVTSEGARLWKSMGGVPALAEAGIVDPVQAEQIVQEVFARQAEGAYAYRLWDMLSLEAWLRARL